MKRSRKRTKMKESTRELSHTRLVVNLSVLIIKLFTMSMTSQRQEKKKFSLGRCSVVVLTAALSILHLLRKILRSTISSRKFLLILGHTWLKILTLSLQQTIFKNASISLGWCIYATWLFCILPMARLKVSSPDRTYSSGSIFEQIIIIIINDQIKFKR